jgi:hypothetical protein
MTAGSAVPPGRAERRTNRRWVAAAAFITLPAGTHNASKKVTGILGALVAAIGTLTVVAGSASALTPTTCNTYQLFSGEWVRYCQWDNETSGGALISGSVSWNYKGDPLHAMSGTIGGYIEDIASDGSCANAKIEWVAGVNDTPTAADTQWIGHVCGNGDKSDINTDFGEGYGYRYTWGVYKIELCTGTTSCVKVWQQQVDGTHP